MAVFALLKLLWVCLSAGNPAMEQALAWLALPSQPSEVALVPWTAVTYMFTHIDFWHLLINCLWLGWFGCMLAEIAGMRMMAVTYFAGGLTGAVAYVCVSAWLWPGTDACLLGASAATLAVVTATLIAEPGKRVQFAFIGAFSLRKLAVAGAVVFLLASMEMAPQQTVAHAGGIAAGAFSALLWKIVTRKNMRVMQQLTRRRLDRIELMDKAKRSGYASLTDDERLRLFNLSAGHPDTERL